MKIRLGSITHSAIRIILVTLDPGPALSTRMHVTFRILRTMRIAQDMSRDDWYQLVFLMTNRDLNLDTEKPAAVVESVTFMPCKASDGP